MVDHRTFDVRIRLVEYRPRVVEDPPTRPHQLTPARRGPKANRGPWVYLALGPQLQLDVVTGPTGPASVFTAGDAT
jgi:hypothetical protein